MNASSASLCVYCKQKKQQFSREHVIPQAFGSFGAKTMVLTTAVCTDCNAKLGRELDEILARDTFEASLRAEKLPVRRHKTDRFRARRLVIRTPDRPEFGCYRGAQMFIDWKTRKLKPLSQVLVRDESGHLHSFTSKEIMEADEKLFRNRPPGSIQIIGAASDVHQLMKIVKSKGARFESEPVDADPPPASSEKTVLLEVEGFIDAAIWRGIAKIAFNYLTKIRGPAYVLDDKFDRIRSYILGDRQDRALVQLTKKPILADESLMWRTTEFHLVLFERQGYGLRGRVSLFNSFTYDVMLCPNLGLIYPIKSGHAFDPIRHEVVELTGITRSLSLR